MEKMKELIRLIRRRKQVQYIKPVIESMIKLIFNVLNNITNDYNDFECLIIDNEGNAMFISFYGEEIKADEAKYDQLRVRLQYNAQRVKDCELNLVEELRKTLRNFEELNCSYVTPSNWFRMNEQTNLHSGAIKIQI